MMQKFLNSIVKNSIYLLVFLLPLFWLPFSFNIFEFNKQYLLFFLVSIAFFAWMARMVFYDKEIRFRRTSLDILVLLFLFVAILSSFFSIDKISSILGFYGKFSDGLIGLLSFGTFYFLITNNTEIKNKEEKKNIIHNSLFTVQSLLKTLLWSSSFVILISYFSIFGLWQRISEYLSSYQFTLPQVMLQRIFNPISGSLEGLAIFLVVVMVLLVGLLLGQKDKSRIKSFGYQILLLSSLFLLLIIDFTSAWIVLLITLSLFVSFALWTRSFRKDVNKLLIPLFLIIIAGFGSFIDIKEFSGLDQTTLFQERVLSQETSWKVSFGSLTENVKSGLLGSGTGTFYYDFLKQKPKEFNQNPLWQLRFDRPGNYFAEIVATMGILGILSYLALIGFFLFISWFVLASKIKVRSIYFPLFFVVLALLIGQVFYYQNTTLAFMFWLFLGLSAVSWSQFETKTAKSSISEKTISFKNFPEISLVFSFFLIITGLTILGMYFFAGKFYWADVSYKNALIKNRIQDLEMAVKLNPYQSQYKIVLSRFYLSETLNELRKPVSDQNQEKIQNLVSSSISQARESVLISPNWVSSWEVSGIIYREIRAGADGALEWGINAFEKAVELEPTNPILHTELGKLYLESDKIEKAKQEFEKANDLKPDYLDALIQGALIYEREDNLDEAITRIKDLAENYPFSIESSYVDVLFQLGRLYFNNGQLDEAVSELEKAIKIFPNNSNVLYSLGVVYQNKRETEKAIEVFEMVLELNPENEDVVQKLKELEAKSEESEEE